KRHAAIYSNRLSRGTRLIMRTPPGLCRLLACACVLASWPTQAATVRVTTWNLNWFPNNGPKEASGTKQSKCIAAAADVLRPLNTDIILLQEMRDYDVCARLADAIRANTYQ